MSNLKDSISSLRALYLAETDQTNKQALYHQYEDALDAALAIADKDIGQRANELNEAIKTLQDAIDELKTAKKKLGDVSKSIKNIATAIDIFVKVAALVAGA